MLVGIPKVIGPDLLYALACMGHGDDIVLADAFYPGYSMSQKCIRADGVEVTDLLDGILTLINPDDFVPDPIIMMEPAKGDTADPTVEERFSKIIYSRWPKASPIKKIDRFAFYERAKKSFAVVVSGSTFKYGCIIIKKGVIPTV
jgi:L-fucose mutarotase